MTTGDPIWMKGLLTIHIAAGSSAFLLAPIALVTAKGGKQHKRWGIVYLWAMGVVAATALPMALYRPVLFLALVAIFSFYLAFSGYRVLKLKDLPRGGHAKPVDWIAGILCFAACAALVVLAIVRPAIVQHMSYVAVAFGVVGLRASGMQMVSFIHKPTEKMFWWYRHFQGFIGSYIAAWTAFSVVTLPRLFGPHLWFWVMPLAIGVPAIIITTAYYKRKFAPRLPQPAVGT
jgi:uncharacterized membrane protein